MSNLKLFILLFAIFFCLTIVQRSRIYFMHYNQNLYTLSNKFTSRLPKIELEVDFEDYLSFNKKLYKIQTK
jgi:hypothetical protein